MPRLRMERTFGHPSFERTWRLDRGPLQRIDVFMNQYPEGPNLGPFGDGWSLCFGVNTGTSGGTRVTTLRLGVIKVTVVGRWSR